MGTECARPQNPKTLISAREKFTSLLGAIGENTIRLWNRLLSTAAKASWEETCCGEKVKGDREDWGTRSIFTQNEICVLQNRSKYFLWLSVLLTVLKCAFFCRCEQNLIHFAYKQSHCITIQQSDSNVWPLKSPRAR